MEQLALCWMIGWQAYSQLQYYFCSFFWVLLNIIGLLDKSDEGSIIFNNKDLTTLNSEQKNKFRRDNYGFVYQNYNLLENLNVKILDDEFRTPSYNEKTMKTNIDGVFLAGVICGGLRTNKWFIENSRDHSEKIIAEIIKS